MNSFLFRGAMLAALTVGVTSTVAFAAPSAGHYAWRASQQVGPRAPLTAPRRSAADCMMPMQDKHSPSSAG
ncbi:hypothetical protein [Sphingobium sp.]|uniref:hypothetical protein n=1 Tax=Sphingobium sp. TaxID=1912891 RepID=UPI0028BF14C1|nr:hypothetical protein [Sphingobium sp.]